MKIAVIGGGSTYTPELVSGFLEKFKTLPISELWLMDLDEERLGIVGGYVQRMITSRGIPFEVHLTDQRQEAIQAASYVITQIRVGGVAARREDEYLGHRHGLIGQETTGIGGMASALRTIPVIMEIAQEISQYAPEAWMINFTNPAGLITEALTRFSPDIKSVGLCNVAITTKMYLLRLLEEHWGIRLNPYEVTLDTLGLNHLTWHRGLRMDREDYWQQALEAVINHLKGQAEPEWSPRLIKTLGMIPNYYLRYFYNREQKIAAQEAWPPSRAEEVLAIEAELLQKYANPSTVELPDELLKRGGAYYSTMATKLLNAIHNDLGETQVLNVPNKGAVSMWPDDWVLELPCQVDGQGIHPIPTEPLPWDCSGLITQVKAYELLTVEAAVSGDRMKAFQALLAHPLGPDLDKIEIVLEDLLETHQQYLSQFWN